VSKLFGRGRSRDARLDAELRDHVERRAADLVARGLSAADARRAARIELGGLEQAKEACRDVRPLRWLSELGRDVRLGLRAMRRERPFAIAVTAILALGIGATVAMFSVLDAVVLRPLPYARPGELVRLTTHLILQDRPDGTSMANLIDWRAESRTFAGMTAFRRTAVSDVTFAGLEAPQRAQEGLVGAEFFSLLGAPVLAGRTFSAAEFERRERVVVLSEGLWRERFGGAPGAIGQTLLVDGHDHVIVGVMPGTFQLPTRETRLWRPLSIIPSWPATLAVRDSDQFEVLGRLRPGVGIADARSEMTVIAARLRVAHPVNQNVDVRITPLVDHVIGARTRRGMWLGFAAVLCLLVIACANVGGLLSARAARRRRELAVRAALGAGRARLVRQLLAEALSLWALAGAAGVVIADGLIALLLAYGPHALPRIDEVALDARALAVAFLGGLVVVMACATIPALTATKSEARTTLTARDRSSLPRSGLQHVLVIGQIAGAVVLVVAALLFARSFLRAQGEDPGYRAEHLLIVRLDLPRDAYPDRAAVLGFFRSARARLTGLPGVVDVGAISDFFIRRNADQWVTVQGRPAGRIAGAPRLAIEGVTPGYFRSTGISVIEGRDFDDRDVEPGAPDVVIVNQSLARWLWPGESALGKQVVRGETPPKDGRWSTVVGVVDDMRREGLDVAPILGAFIPAFPRGMDMTVRASIPVEGLIPAVREQLRAVDRGLPVTRVTSAGAHLAERLDARRFESQILSAFSVVALVLAAAGLYALLAYQVTLRTQEIGIRSALGADRQTIVTMMLTEGWRLAVPGTLLGLAAAIGASRVMQSLLYETAAISVPSYGAAAGCVLLVATAAIWVPARRAARVSPVTALRSD
jgi:predicted permease